jgi:hypothetical protein
VAEFASCAPRPAPIVVVSPPLAVMHDQEKLAVAGIEAAKLNSIT